MVIVSLFSLNLNIQSGIIIVNPNPNSLNSPEGHTICPLCNGWLIYRDRRLRYLKNLLGEESCYSLRRLYCAVCERLHTEIPNIIQPYKHYDSATIQSVLDGSEEAEACAADDSTIRRWKVTFAQAEPDIAQRLASVYARAADEKAPIEPAAMSLATIRGMVKCWLAFVMNMLINSGQKICTQFAFCHSRATGKLDIVKKTTIGGRQNDKTIKDTS